MGFNKKALSKATTNLDARKAQSKPRDIIYDPAGQWKHPGQPTRIPGGDITMRDVPYPVMAYPNIGQPQMMYPEQNYNFPNADYVDEYPQMKKGGLKKYSRDITATNRLFTKNPFLKKKKSKKRKIFDPNSQYFQYGGLPTNVQDEPDVIYTPSMQMSSGGMTYYKEGGKLGPIPINSGRKVLRDWTYGKSIGMLQEQDGGELPADYQEFINYSETAPENRRPAPNAVYGDPNDYDHYGMWEALGKPKNFEEALQMNPDWTPDEYDGMYHGFSVNPNTGVFLKAGKPGFKEGDTTWMEVAGHYLSPRAQVDTPVFDIDLQRFRYIPNENQEEYIETELTPEEIEVYRQGGYIVEELDKFQKGGTYYTVPGSKGVYRKVNGKWEVDFNRSGSFQPLSKGDVAKRIAAIEKNKTQYYDKDYGDLVSSKSAKYQAAPKPQESKPTAAQTKAQQNFDKNFKVTDKSNYAKVEDKIEKDKQDYIDNLKNVKDEKTREYLSTPEAINSALENIENEGWFKHGNTRTYGQSQTYYGPSGEMKKSGPEASTTGRAWEYVTNPLTAFEYAVSGGGAENMPHNINAMRMAGVDPGVVEGRNLVGNALNTFNLVDAGDKVVRNTAEGNLGTAALEAMRFLPGARINTGAGKYLNKTYNKIATGNSRLPVAWKMEQVSDVPSNIVNKYNLTNDEATVLGKYINSPYNIQRGSEESKILDDLIENNSALLNDVNKPVTKVLNHSTQADKDLIPTGFGSNFNFKGNRSWTLGTDPRFANSDRTRLVIPSKYSKNLDFVGVPYDDPRLAKGWNQIDTEYPLKDLRGMSSEQELIGNVPSGYKVIGSSNEGGFKNIFIKPVKSKEVPNLPNTLETPMGFQNRVFDSNVQLGSFQGKGHLSEKGYNYRTLGNEEIKAIQESKGVFPKKGKAKGGNENVKYWTKGNEKNWYAENPNQQVIRVKENKFNNDKVVDANAVEVYNHEKGNFEPILIQQQNGGSIDLELTPEEIEWYKSQGYEVEELD